MCASRYKELLQFFVAKTLDMLIFSGVLQYELHLAIFMVTQLDTDPDWGPTDAQNEEMLRAFQSLGQYRTFNSTLKFTTLPLKHFIGAENSKSYPLRF